MILPTSFKPETEGDFIGETKRVASVVLVKARKLRFSGTGSYRLLFHGSPGVGKTTLAMLTANALTGHALAIERLNGQSVTVDRVREWRDRAGYRPLWGDRRCIVVDECDAMGQAALNEWRTFSDTLPPCTDYILTTNKSLAELQPQFQSRAQQYGFGEVTGEEIGEFLTNRFGIPAEVAETIGQNCGGDVRAALCDAESWLDFNGVEGGV